MADVEQHAEQDTSTSHSERFRNVVNIVKESESDGNMADVEQHAEQDTGTSHSGRFRSAVHKTVSFLRIRQSQKLTDDDNRKIAKWGAKSITEAATPPISENSFKFTHGLYWFVDFLAWINVVYGIVDLALEPTMLSFKVTSLVLTFLDAVVGALVLGDVIKYSRHRQLVENVTTFVMVYVLLLCAVLGFAFDGSYRGGDSLSIVAIVLFSIDCVLYIVDLGIFLYMLKNVWSQIKDVYPLPGDRLNEFQIPLGCISYEVITVFIFTLLGNTVLFIVMLVNLVIQVEQDNLGSATTVIVSQSAAYMLFAAIFLPLVNICLFGLLNGTWVYVVLFEVAKQSKENLLTSGTLDRATINQTEDERDLINTRASEIGSLSGAQRVFSPLLEWWSWVVLSTWTGLVVAYAISLILTDRLGGVLAWLVVLHITNIQLCVIMWYIVFIAVLLFVLGWFNLILFIMCKPMGEGGGDHMA
ncbi:uncharacterized protein [Ptychodera flava]|uniref:uncharacterized protein n=1 Tax=Ptychodera flava TaxID=63121 RepID=UPI00396A6CAD